MPVTMQAFAVVYARTFSAQLRCRPLTGQSCVTFHEPIYPTE